MLVLLFFGEILCSEPVTTERELNEEGNLRPSLEMSAMEEWGIGLHRIPFIRSTFPFSEGM